MNDLAAVGAAAGDAGVAADTRSHSHLIEALWTYQGYLRTKSDARHYVGQRPCWSVAGGMAEWHEECGVRLHEQFGYAGGDCPNEKSSDCSGSGRAARQYVCECAWPGVLTW